MQSIDYKQKYLKYKAKYLELKGGDRGRPVKKYDSTTRYQFKCPNNKCRLHNKTTNSRKPIWVESGLSCGSEGLVLTCQGLGSCGLSFSIDGLEIIPKIPLNLNCVNSAVSIIPIN